MTHHCTASGQLLMGSQPDSSARTAYCQPVRCTHPRNKMMSTIHFHRRQVPGSSACTANKVERILFPPAHCQKALALLHARHSCSQYIIRLDSCCLYMSCMWAGGCLYTHVSLEPDLCRCVFIYNVMFRYVVCASTHMCMDTTFA